MISWFFYAEILKELFSIDSNSNMINIIEEHSNSSTSVFDKKDESWEGSFSKDKFQNPSVFDRPQVQNHLGGIQTLLELKRNLEEEAKILNHQSHLSSFSSGPQQSTPFFNLRNSPLFSLENLPSLLKASEINQFHFLQNKDSLFGNKVISFPQLVSHQTQNLERERIGNFQTTIHNIYSFEKSLQLLSHFNSYDKVEHSKIPKFRALFQT